MSYDIYAHESESAGKSVLLAFVLTFFFGPFGMLYSTIVGGIIMLFVCFFLGAITLGFGLVLLWPVCIIWGTVAAACSGPTGEGRQRPGRWDEEWDEPTDWERSRGRRRYASAREEDDWDDE